MNLIRAISNFGITLIGVVHVMKAMMNISTRLIVLNSGGKITEGKPQDTVRNQKVVDAYPG